MPGLIGKDRELIPQGGIEASERYFMACQHEELIYAEKWLCKEKRPETLSTLNTSFEGLKINFEDFEIKWTKSVYLHVS